MSNAPRGRGGGASAPPPQQLEKAKQNLRVGYAAAASGKKHTERMEQLPMQAPMVPKASPLTAEGGNEAAATNQEEGAKAGQSTLPTEQQPQEVQGTEDELWDAATPHGQQKRDADPLKQTVHGKLSNPENELIFTKGNVAQSIALELQEVEMVMAEGQCMVIRMKPAG
eukprot:6146199-Prymnesium_polylepis.1